MNSWKRGLEKKLEHDGISSLCDVINIICFECCIKFSDIFERVKIYMHTYFYMTFEIALTFL